MNFLKDNFKIFAVIFILIISNDSNAQMFWNQSCQFAGTNTSYISVPNSTGVNLTSDFTLEAWVNPTSVSGTEKGIISKGSALGLSLRYALKISTTGRVTISTNGLLRLTSTTALTANTWTHVCATFNSVTDSFAIYLNGVKNIAAVIGSAEPSSNTDSLFIGIAGSGLGYAGLLDEVRLWNKSLTVTQVSQYFRTSLGTTGGRLYDGLVLSLPFQRNNSGGTVFTTQDNTGNGNHGKGRNVTAENQTGTNYRTIVDNESLNLFGSGEYVAGPSSTLISPTSQITLEAWIFPRNLTSSPSIISKNSSTSYSLGVSSAGKVNFIPKGGGQMLESKSVIIPARWTHIAATYNGSTTTLYINGVQDTSTNTIAGAIGSNSDSLIIGGDRTGAPVTNFFNGFIDEVRISNYAKTAAQVTNYLFKSIDSVNQPVPASNNVCYNLDGTLADNGDGGPRLYMRDSAKFSHPGGVANMPVAPMLRDDGKQFGTGFTVKYSGKKVPLTGGSGTVDDTLNIPFNVNINDINIFVAINHTDETNLDVFLIAPNGEQATLSTDGVTAGAYDNLITVFDDQAVNAVNLTSFTSFTPDIRSDTNLFRKFGGDYSQGKWILRVTDDGGTADTGRIYAWGIQFNSSPISGSITTLNLTSIIQGFWDGATMVQDTMRVYLRNTSPPYVITDSSKVFLSPAGFANISFANTGTSTKYIALKHRNSIETWSATGVNFKQDSTTTYDFTTGANKAYGNNLVLRNGKYTLYNGNVNTDFVIDLTDVVAVYNASNAFTLGYTIVDLSGDNFVTLEDVLLAYNNAANFVSKITPP